MQIDWKIARNIKTNKTTYIRQKKNGIKRERNINEENNEEKIKTKRNNKSRMTYRDFIAIIKCIYIKILIKL